MKIGVFISNTREYARRCIISTVGHACAFYVRLATRHDRMILLCIISPGSDARRYSHAGAVDPPLHIRH